MKAPTFDIDAPRAFGGLTITVGVRVKRLWRVKLGAWIVRLAALIMGVPIVLNRIDWAASGPHWTFDCRTDPFARFHSRVVDARTGEKILGRRIIAANAEAGMLLCYRVGSDGRVVWKRGGPVFEIVRHKIRIESIERTSR